MVACTCSILFSTFSHISTDAGKCLLPCLGITCTWLSCHHGFFHLQWACIFCCWNHNHQMSKPPLWGYCWRATVRHSSCQEASPQYTRTSRPQWPWRLGCLILQRIWQPSTSTWSTLGQTRWWYLSTFRGWCCWIQSPTNGIMLQHIMSSSSRWLTLSHLLHMNCHFGWVQVQWWEPQSPISYCR